MFEKLKFTYRANRYKYVLDKEEIRLLCQHIKKGDCVADIGSHKGGYLYWMLEQIGPTGSAYAFEPQAKLFTYLQNIKSKYKYSHLTLEQKGMSETSGKVDLFIPKTKSGTSPGASVVATKHAADQDVETIELTSLDEYFYAKNILPSFLKIDVEGHEAAVIKGGAKLLANAHPTILMECENRHLPAGNVNDVFELILNHGYLGYFIENRKTKELKDFNVAQHQQQGEGSFWEADDYVNNFFFVHPTKIQITKS